MGIDVLAYFVSDGWGGGRDKFKRMYGNDSKLIDVTQITPIVKTLNELFLKK